MRQTSKNEKLKKAAVIAGVSLATFLCLLKAFAAFYTGSLAILSSLIDSLSDIFASCVSYAAVRVSSKPATCEHRYGFGRAEALSALFQSAFVAGSGLFVMYDGINRLFHPQPVENTSWGVVIMLISFVCTFILIAFQRRVAKITDSKAVYADSAHYVVDLLTNASIVLSLIVTSFFSCPWFDTIAALGISIYLIYNAYDLGKDAVGELTDRELKPEIRAQVADIVINSKGVNGYHDLRTRDLGGVYCIEIHLEIDGNLTLLEAHEISSRVEEKIKKHFNGAQIIIHQDPHGLHEERLDDNIDGVCRI